LTADFIDLPSNPIRHFNLFGGFTFLHSSVEAMHGW